MSEQAQTNLGKLCTSESRRDAVHVCVVPIDALPPMTPEPRTSQSEMQERIRLMKQLAVAPEFKPRCRDCGDEITGIAYNHRCGSCHQQLRSGEYLQYADDMRREMETEQ